MHHAERLLLHAVVGLSAPSNTSRTFERSLHLTLDLLLLADCFSLYFRSFTLSLAGRLFCCTLRF
jgi:hypothetical protein